MCIRDRSQVAHYEPIYTRNINEADEYCTDRLLRGYCGAWFAGITGTKVDSLDCDLIDGLSKLHPNWQIVVEADGAKEKWLKAPKTTEPVSYTHLDVYKRQPLMLVLSRMIFSMFNIALCLM